MVVPELEDAVVRLGEETWTREPGWCLAQMEEFYEGGLAAFGPVGPTPAELLEAELWFLLDCPLPTGETPLWRARREQTSRAIELLSRSELRVWRIEAVEGCRRLGTVCPLGTGRARLQLAREPAGVAARGALVVGRSVPVGPERWALLGGAPVVAPAGAAHFERFVRSLDAPRGELWRVHGGMLIRAAWTWPERDSGGWFGDAPAAAGA